MDALERIAAQVDPLLVSSPDPEQAERYFERWRQTWGAEPAPRVLRAAIAIFGCSGFLSEAVLREPQLIAEIVEAEDFHRVLTKEDYLLRRPMACVPLAHFRRREILRIALRDILGIARLPEITLELSHLADAILEAAYRNVRAGFVARHGEPRVAGGAICGFSILALGKLGGEELNYSSDIDLMFVHAGNGETDGPERISNKEFYKKVANSYTALLSAYTAEGQCYRVDLRLRPDGTLGEVCISLEGARRYYSGRARDWEKQMLIKARVAAGEPEPGRELLEFAEPLIYRTSLDFRAVEAVSETRQRISEKMAARRKSGGLDIKLTPGGIRDIEFLVQCLQRLHGGREPWVRHGGTMLALGRLRDKELLSPGEYARLANAYQFLRYLEHRLQLEEDRQTHTLPADPERLDALARRMPPEATGAALYGRRLRERLDEHLAAVREIYDRVVHGSAPGYSAYGPGAAEAAAGRRSRPLHAGDRLERFRERAAAPPSPEIVELIELSPFLGDELLREPSLAEEIAKPVPSGDRPRGDAGELRRFFRSRMFRIQAESILGPAPIFDTLAKTSALADAVIAAAYEMAGGADSRMIAIALGRLGMREFDLGSDADLVFVMPDDGDAARATATAERMIGILGAYTGEGVMFAVDTRLRPNGRAGDLVPSEAAYKSYFASLAEAWEGISYMKARVVAGDARRGTAFLHELQQVDWRRYGQGMRSREELLRMRARLEKEQGPRNPLKAGAGGYYDIDFALMYLRLRGAGVFYKVLNTPERIGVIEGMGHLDRADADFLREAATFYRAIDHGQRLAAGQAEGTLPASQAQLELLARLVRRWTPGHLNREPLDVTLRQIRDRTRRCFNRLFGSV